MRMCSEPLRCSLSFSTKNIHMLSRDADGRPDMQMLSLTPTLLASVLLREEKFSDLTTVRCVAAWALKTRVGDHWSRASNPHDSEKVIWEKIVVNLVGFV